MQSQHFLFLLRPFSHFALTNPESRQSMLQWNMNRKCHASNKNPRLKSCTSDRHMYSVTIACSCSKISGLRRPVAVCSLLVSALGVVIRHNVERAKNQFVRGFVRAWQILSSCAMSSPPPLSFPLPDGRATPSVCPANS